MPEHDLIAERSLAKQLELQIREVTHRCANDLSLVSGLLRVQSQRTQSTEARAALRDAADRVAILAQARAASRNQQPTLETALRLVCSALNSQAEPRSILVMLDFGCNSDGLSENQISNLALCVNELATNALKHAFRHGGEGRVTISVRRCADGDLSVCVDDDGLPFAQPSENPAGGMGLDLVRRIMASVDGVLKVPEPGSKTFEIKISAQLR